MHIFRHHVAIKLAPLIAHLVFAVSLSVLVYTAKNYLALTRITVPIIEAVSPVADDRTVQIITRLLPESDQGKGARKLVQGQANMLRALHESWLADTQLQVAYARNQLILLVLLSTLAAGLVIVLHVRAKDADKQFHNRLPVKPGR